MRTPRPGTSVGAAVTATDPNGDTLTYSMDPGNFTIARDGVVTTTKVLNHEEASSHTAVVTATDQHGDRVQVTLTVRVNNLDEPGTVSLDNLSPKAGDTLNASLTDPDGAASGVAWQWQNGDGADWTDISGATSHPHTPWLPPTWAGNFGPAWPTPTPREAGRRQPAGPPQRCPTTRRPSTATGR